MGKTSTNRPATTPGASPAKTDLFDRWLASRRSDAELARVRARAAEESAPPAGTEPVRSQAPDGTAVGRAIVEALAAPATPATPAAPVTTATPTPIVTDPIPEPERSTPRNLGAAAGAAPSEVTRPKEVAIPPHAITPLAVAVPAPAAAEGRPAEVVTLARKHGARRVLTVALALAALATLAAGVVAGQTRTTTAYAVVAGVAALTLLLASLRGRATGTQVTIVDGQLRIVQGTSQHRFPLAGTYPPIDVVGAPGDRGWKVLIQRKGMAPYEITPSMVDPVEFTDALRRFRPNV